MGKTIGTLLFFVVVGALPKVPWWAKLAIQLIAGAVIYNVMAETAFPLPAPDTNPIGAEMYGGNVAKAWGDDSAGFAFLSIGVLSTVLGVLTTIIATIIGLVLGKKSDKE